jgi:hypothetical protein
LSGPPGNETDITQNKKIRQCVIAMILEKHLPLGEPRFRTKTKKNCKNLLARGKSCGRLAPVCVPRFLILGFWFGAFVGKAEK